MTSQTKFWVAVCHYHDWIDLLETYANIVDTSDGSTMRGALQMWCETVSDKVDAIPPDLETIFKESQFGTEL